VSKLFDVSLYVHHCGVETDISVPLKLFKRLTTEYVKRYCENFLAAGLYISSVRLIPRHGLGFLGFWDFGSIRLGKRLRAWHELWECFEIPFFSK
jgi:hypothetical protein